MKKQLKIKMLLSSAVLFGAILGTLLTIPTTATAETASGATLEECYNVATNLCSGSVTSFSYSGTLEECTFECNGIDGPGGQL